MLDPKTARSERTVSDWLRHAQEAESQGDSAEALRCLDAAEALTASFYDYRTLLAGVLELRTADAGRVCAVADRTLEASQEDGEVWGFRDVAKVRKERFDDRAGARAALDEGALSFRKKGARGYEWVLLAKGYNETLADLEGARAALEAGREASREQREPADLADVGLAWAALLGRDEGAALVLEAEHLASDDEGAAWGIANAWSALDDEAAVRRVLTAALERAKTAEGALHVARAWASHGKVGDAREALDRAIELASTLDEWLEVGEVALKNELGAELLRAAVGQAEALAESEEERARVSSAYATWLGDEVAAERLGPRGVRPDVRRTPAQALAGWKASASGLFDWLRARASEEMLRSISEADYGSDAAQHFAALRDICTTGLVPRTLRWEPGEVLRLRRWSSGEGIDNLERALCCTILCLANDDSGLLTNGPILAESCIALGGEEATREALSLSLEFFAWLGGTHEAIDDDDESDVAPDADALLLLLLAGAARDPNDARLVGLAETLLTHPDFPPEALAKLFKQTTQLKLWNRLIKRHLGPPDTTSPPLTALRERLLGVQRPT